ncbi:MAG: hypothetical protein J7518_02405 [Nocardioidaceae bacterium]|nr:hypothetical protein [Nocardioidaceae bacterium]
MSKERARRREAREREAAERAARLAETARRRERRQALVAPIAGPLRRTRLALSTGKQSGSLADRRRTRTRVVLMTLIFLQVVVWLVRPDWQARLGALVIALIAFPVIAAFTL